MMLRAAAVRVPCSTSNLGAGFDCVGLALNGFIEVAFEPGGSELEVVREGTLAALRLANEEDLTVQAFLQSGRFIPGDQPAGRLTMRSTMPVGKGLGASAAAIVAGFDLGLAVRGFPPDPEATFAYGLEHDGHGDNAAPSVFGGLMAVIPAPGAAVGHWKEAGGENIGVPRHPVSSESPVTSRRRTHPLTTRLELSPSVGFAYAAPSRPLSTEHARRALPKDVSHAAAARSSARAVALVRGLATGRSRLLRAAVEDELHTSYRLPLIGGGESAVSAGYRAGAWAVTTSGAGSGLIAMCEPEEAETVAQAMRTAFNARAEARPVASDGVKTRCVGFALQPEMEGMRRI